MKIFWTYKLPLDMQHRRNILQDFLVIIRKSALVSGVIKNDRMHIITEITRLQRVKSSCNWNNSWLFSCLSKGKICISHKFAERRLFWVNIATLYTLSIVETGNTIVSGYILKLLHHYARNMKDRCLQDLLEIQDHSLWNVIFPRYL